MKVIASQLVSQLSYLLKVPQLRRNLRNLSTLFLILGIQIVVYAFLFHVIMEQVEGQSHSWATGVYWTLTVMTTLGFGDITFTSDLGRIFSIVVLLSGVFMLLIVLPFAFIRYFYAPWVEAQIRLRAPRSLPEDTRDHVVICHYDAMAKILVERLRLNNIPHFVLEPNPTVAADLHGDGVPVMFGAPEAAETWAAARIGNARAVVANLGDATNTNIILTVKSSAAKVNLMAVADDEDAIDILELAGADHVLPLKRRLGEHLANRVNAGHAEAHEIGRFKDLVIAEFPVHNTPLVGRTIRDIALRRRLGINVVGVWERGKFEPAHADRVLADSSVPVVIGTADQLLELNALLVIYDTNYSATVVIGGGKVGCAAARALRRREVAVHMVECDEGVARRAQGVPDQMFVGPAADRDVLLAAGLATAPAAILTTNDDSTNIYLTLYCRKLNPNLRIISRITSEENLDAIHRAGADFALSYSSLGAEATFSGLQGRGMMMLGAGIELFNSSVPRSLVGKTLEQCAIGATTGLNVIAVQHQGTIIPNPPASLPLPADGELLMLGEHDQRLAFVKRFT